MTRLTCFVVVNAAVVQSAELLYCNQQVAVQVRIAAKRCGGGIDISALRGLTENRPGDSGAGRH